jgi:predicted ArsR family transcriptional regulator
MTDEFAVQVQGVGALAEPARRALYLYVVGQDGPVSRDEAAAGAGLPRHTAKFHLDKLVDEGLLRTEYKRLTGRQGPGAGRPAKLYRRADRELAVSLPQRHYEVAGDILADALDSVRQTDPAADQAVQRAAAAAGQAAAGSAAPATSGDPLDQVAGLLAGRGYEPHRDGDTVVLANCPFHALAREHTDLVCSMNLGLISAMLAALDQDGVRAELAPAPGRCCVRLSTA